MTNKRTPWNKGFTKENHLSVRKISDTMKRLRIDNFSSWRDNMRKEGKIKSAYPIFKENGDLAELIGAILGDGHLEKHPRADRLILSSNSKNHGFIKRYSNLIAKVINKKPKVKKQKNNCVKIYLYEKYLSERFNIPCGSRRNIKWITPRWIWKNEKNLLRYLRGLYEAEGNFAEHKPTYTYKMFFVNRNQSLLYNVYKALPQIGIDSAHLEKHRVTVSKKSDVFRLKNLIKYRNY